MEDTPQNHAAAVASALSALPFIAEQLKVYQGQGDKSGAEGTRQMLTRILDTIDGHLGTFREMSKSEVAPTLPERDRDA